MANRRLLISGIVLFIPLLTHSYTLFSISSPGEFILPVDARSRGMGSTSLAQTSNLSSLNPASASFIDKTTLSLTCLPEFLLCKDTEGEIRVSKVKFTNVGIAFPLVWGISSGTSFSQKVDMNFKIYGKWKIGEEEYTLEIEREGDINSLGTFLTKRIGKFALGAKFVYNFGYAVEKQTIDFANSEYTDAVDTMESKYKGYNYDFGFLYDRGRFGLGGFFSDETDVKEGITLPRRFGVGVHYIIGNTEFTMDCINQDDKLLTGVGVERRFGRKSIRGGYCYRPFCFREIVEHTISLGYGLQFFKKNAIIDFGVELCLRSSDELDEKVIRTSVTFTGIEKWERRK